MLENVGENLCYVLIVHVAITVEENFSCSAVSMHVRDQYHWVLRMKILDHFLYFCNFWEQKLVCISPVSV